MNKCAYELTLMRLQLDTFVQTFVHLCQIGYSELQMLGVLFYHQKIISVMMPVLIQNLYFFIAFSSRCSTFLISLFMFNFATLITFGIIFFFIAKVHCSNAPCKTTYSYIYETRFFKHALQLFFPGKLNVDCCNHSYSSFDFANNFQKIGITNLKV